MNANTAKWLSLISGIILLLCGIWLVFTPLEAYIMISLFIPISLLAHGIAGIVNYVSAKKTQDVSGWLLADGIISAIIGLWLMFSPGVTAASLPYIFAFWVLFGGVLRITAAVAMRKVSGYWVWLLVFGIIAVISGLFLLYHPFFTGAIVAYLVAWTFVFFGIMGVLAFFNNKGDSAVA